MREEANWWAQASARDKEMSERLFTGELYEGAAFHAKKLDSHYIQSRYPTGAGGPPQDLYSREIAKEALECLEEILRFAKENL